MFRDKKVVVVMPAYNAVQTLRQTYDEVKEQGIVDHIILVDDCSRDETVALARTLGDVQVHVHEKNTGYGGNQKTCYRLALAAGRRWTRFARRASRTKSSSWAAAAMTTPCRSRPNSSVCVYTFTRKTPAMAATRRPVTAIAGVFLVNVD